MFLFFDDDQKHDKLELFEILDNLIAHWENEVVEFKEANSQYNIDKFGQYFSAISNEANLKNCQYGWIIFGVRENDRKIVGTKYKADNQTLLEKLKYEISENLTDNMSFVDIYEIFPLVEGKPQRILMFKVPAAVTGMPTAWKNRYYGRNGESLVPLSQSEIDCIRKQNKIDWSKQTIDKATIGYLDKDAISLVRQKYKEKMNKPHIAAEADAMTDEEFLTKLKLIINGKITNAAMLLLGNEDYDYVFSTPPEASWRLYDTKDSVKDYEIFKVPFITLSDRIFEKIRNLTYRYMPNQLTLFPIETKQYNMWLLRELMNNCIAHSDYTIGGRIYLNEFEDKIILSNPGTFLPGSIEPVLKPSYNPPFYRNQLLAEVMVKFNMIDTQTMGIRRVFKIQQEKFFPLPDYDFSTSNQVRVTVYGKVLDENYSRVLFEKPDFDLDTVFLIDRVQKHEPITKEAVKHLRKLGVIEGNLPNIFISADIAESIGERAKYVKNKAFDEAYYRDMIIQYLGIYKKAKKKDFIDLLNDKLPNTLSEKQKEAKIKYLLYSLSKDNIIATDSNNKRLANWILVD